MHPRSLVALLAAGLLGCTSHASTSDLGADADLGAPRGPGPDGGGGGGGGGGAGDLGDADLTSFGSAGSVGVAMYPVIVPRTNIDASLAAGAQTGADIAVDPTNLPYYNHLLGASDDAATDQISVYETNDGATSWRTHKLLAAPAPYTGPSRHPAVAYDAAGNGFVSYLAFDAAASDDRVAIATRLAGAGSFGKPVLVSAGPADRQRVAVDRAAASPYLGRVYVAWTDGQHVFLASSVDSAASFGGPAQIDDDGTSVTSPYVVTAADGSVYVAWLDVARGQLRIDRSGDGGQSWGADHVIHQLVTTGVTSPTIAAPQSGVRNAPLCDVDRSTGPRKGSIYCVYHDAAGASGLDVFLRRSDDLGATWTDPLRMNDDPAGVAVDQFLPRVMVDDSNAKVAVAWYDTRDDAAHVQTDVYFTRANDGSSFVTPVRITTARTDETRPGASAQGFGESLGMEAWKGRARVLWTDSRAGDEDLWSCIIDFAHFQFFFAGGDSVTAPAGGSGSMNVTVQPVNGFTASVTLQVLNLPAGASAGFSVNPVPPNGGSVVTIDAGGAPPGTYNVTLKGNGGGEGDSRPFTLVVQ